MGERGDIIARYRIPAQKTTKDYKLQLPDDSDSSKFSSDGDVKPQPKSTLKEPTVDMVDSSPKDAVMNDIEKAVKDL